MSKQRWIIDANRIPFLLIIKRPLSLMINYIINKSFFGNTWPKKNEKKE